MSLGEYLVLFVFVAIMGAGLPGPGDASLIAAGTLAGEGRLNVSVVLATAMVAWMLGSVAGFQIGAWQGRPLLDHPSVGTKAIIGAIVLAAIGVAIRFGWSRWHGARPGQSA